MQKLAECQDDTDGIQGFNEIVFGTGLHSGQLDVALHARHETNLISPGNSWGKTEFIAREAARWCWLKLVHGSAYTSPREWIEKDYRALICSYQFDIAKESYQRLQQKYDAGGVFAGLVSRIIRSDPPKIEFTNGAVLDFGSLDQGGRHVEATRRQAIWVDEVGHMPGFRDIYRGILFPRTIGVGGLIWLLGTPKIHTDPWLYEIATGQDPYYYFREGSSYENTYWPAQERERIERNPELFNRNGSLTMMGQQVVNGKFILAGGHFFPRLHVLNLFKGNHQFYVPPPGGITAWDLAGSKKNSDATVGVTLDTASRPWRVARLEHLPGGSADWEEKLDLIEACYQEDKPYSVGIDVTGPTGDSIEEALRARGLPVDAIHYGGTGSKKYDMLRNLQSRLEMHVPGEERTKGWIRFPNERDYPELEPRRKEFDFYKLDDAKLTTDTVMALAMAVKLAVDYEPVPAYTGPAF